MDVQVPFISTISIVTKDNNKDEGAASSSSAAAAAAKETFDKYGLVACRCIKTTTQTRSSKRRHYRCLTFLRTTRIRTTP
mmetsp:Transcript_2496/g.3963  ORF Transcript_2496/g.3963 Transcript_2496/m.3963 type:complete len:80 (+) Transcript_2496:329-568(+)